MENEAPNTDTGPESRTLASLKLKKEALARQRREHHQKIKALERDMAALDGAMRVFDPKTWAGRQAGTLMAKKRKHIAARFILDFLREAEEPVLASNIATAWLKVQDLQDVLHAPR